MRRCLVEWRTDDDVWHYCMLTRDHDGDHTCWLCAVDQ